MAQILNFYFNRYNIRGYNHGQQRAPLSEVDQLVGLEIFETLGGGRPKTALGQFCPKTIGFILQREPTIVQKFLEL